MKTWRAKRVEYPPFGARVAFERVRESFAKQGLMGLLGAEVSEVGEGWCVIEVPYSEKLTQQQLHGRGLSRPVWSQKTKYRVLSHAEVELLQRHYVPVGLGKPSGLYDSSHVLITGIISESEPIISRSRHRQ